MFKNYFTYLFIVTLLHSPFFLSFFKVQKTRKNDSYGKKAISVKLQNIVLKKNQKRQGRLPLKKERRLLSKTNKQVGTQESEFLKKLRQKILELKDYPKLAKKLKQEGTVHLEVMINRNGELLNISIKKKNPSHILNQAAYTTLKKIQKLPPLSRGPQRDLKVEIPITYSLED